MCGHPAAPSVQTPGRPALDSVSLWFISADCCPPSAPATLCAVGGLGWALQLGGSFPAESSGPWEPVWEGTACEQPGLPYRRGREPESGDPV